MARPALSSCAWALSGIALGSCAAHSSPIVVALWSGGDDGLTQKLYGAIDRAFRGDSAYSVSSMSSATADLTVLLESHVGWEKVGSDTRIHYKVKYTTANPAHESHVEGECIESAVSQCADQIKAGAKSMTANYRIERTRER